MIELAKRVEKYLLTVNKTIDVAIMGCVVNGPGEAKHADLGIAGGKGEAILFKKGKFVKRITEAQIYDTLVFEIDRFESK